MTLAGCPHKATNAINKKKNSKTANTRETCSVRRRRRRVPRHHQQYSALGTLLPLAMLVFHASSWATAAPLSTVPEATEATDAKAVLPAQNEFFKAFQAEMNTQRSSWSNPCGGHWIDEPTKKQPRLSNSKRCKKRKNSLTTLKARTVLYLNGTRADNESRQYVNSVTDSDTTSTQAIDIRKMVQLNLHIARYEFLPKLNANASNYNLSLARFSRDMQLFAASFSYMLHAQLHWDTANLNRKSALSAELQRMRNSSLDVLCSIELYVNETKSLLTQQQLATRKEKRRIRTVSKAVMERHLQKFNTPVVRLHKQAVLAARNEGSPAQPEQPRESDLVYLKTYFIEYLQQMVLVLDKHLASKCRRQQPRPNKKGRRKPKRLNASLKPKSKTKSKQKPK